VVDTNTAIYVKFKQGVKTSEIAKQHGMTKNAVIGRIDRLRRKIAAGTIEEPAMSQLPCTIMELTRASCRYIMDADNKFYCGADRVRGSYCAQHAQMCYISSKLSAEEIAIRRAFKSHKHYRMPIARVSAAGRG